MSLVGRIRVQVADDHDVVVEGICALLQNKPDIEIVGPHINCGAAFMPHVRVARPDVLLTDVKMPNFDMPSALDQLAHEMPQLRVIVITAYDDPEWVKLAMAKGAAGYLLKEEALSNLLALAIREVAAGRIWFSPRASQSLLQATISAPLLSPYQHDVLRLMARGETVDHIAQTLHRSVMALYRTQAQIREKLGVETNEQAILAAIRDRLVPAGVEIPIAHSIN